MQLITFDFHNTLARCDTWFDLEVYSIASAVALDLGLVADLELLDSGYRALRAEVMRSGIEISASDAVKTTLSSHGLMVDGTGVDLSVDRLMRAALDDLTPMPGAIETIKYLKARGHVLGVVSSAAHHDFVEWALATFAILDEFDVVLTSVTAGMYKSRPEIYAQALAGIGAAAELSLHIGDSIKWDVETASLAGMRTAWMRSDQKYTSEAVPDMVFDSLEHSGPAIDLFVRGLV